MTKIQEAYCLTSAVLSSQLAATALYLLAWAITSMLEVGEFCTSFCLYTSIILGCVCLVLTPVWLVLFFKKDKR